MKHILGNRFIFFLNINNIVIFVCTHIERGKTVPAEDVFAPLAHHLRAALVLLDGHAAHGAQLDELRARQQR